MNGIDHNGGVTVATCTWHRAIAIKWILSVKPKVSMQDSSAQLMLRPWLKDVGLGLCYCNELYVYMYCSFA